MMDSDHLQRFIGAQANTYAIVHRELVRGHKTSHWKWFIFPQLRGLGSSEMARTYAIALLDEARAYLAHPLLGSRLRECVSALQDLPQDLRSSCGLAAENCSRQRFSGGFLGKPMNVPTNCLAWGRSEIDE